MASGPEGLNSYLTSQFLIDSIAHIFRHCITSGLSKVDIFNQWWLMFYYISSIALVYWHCIYLILTDWSDSVTELPQDPVTLVIFCLFSSLLVSSGLVSILWSVTYGASVVKARYHNYKLNDETTSNYSMQANMFKLLFINIKRMIYVPRLDTPLSKDIMVARFLFEILDKL